MKEILQVLATILRNLDWLRFLASKALNAYDNRMVEVDTYDVMFWDFNLTAHLSKFAHNIHKPVPVEIVEAIVREKKLPIGRAADRLPTVFRYLNVARPNFKNTNKMRAPAWMPAYVEVVLKKLMASNSINNRK